MFDTLKKNTRMDHKKYRFRLLPTKPARDRTRSFDRIEAFKEITRRKEAHEKISRVKFHGRKISQEHRDVLWECARLWQELDKMETEVISRSKRRKKPVT